MLIDRDLFLQVGGFDKDFFAVFEDVDLGWRLWLAGERIAFAPESVTYHRGHATLASQGSVKMRYLMHRNALLTIIKNYEESTFRRILPLALVMAVKRAVRCSGVRKESFYLWSNVDHDVPASESMMEALNHLVAVEDVLESLPRLLARRSRVQSLRKKSDEEILALFRDPLRPIVEDPEYVAQELEYLKFLDLDRMFPVADYERFAADLDDQLSLKIRELRNELEGIQWQGVRSLAHPNNRSKRVGFLQLYRSLGIRKALAYSAKKFRRGL
jgi:hypothetical protein